LLALAVKGKWFYLVAAVEVWYWYSRWLVAVMVDWLALTSRIGDAMSSNASIFVRVVTILSLFGPHEP
jgi:hypothetical protein